MAPFDDPIFNIKFVRIIEKNPAIWNHTLPEYSQRSIIEKAWSDVAKEAKDSVPNCRDRWRNIRGCFLRSMKKPTSGLGARKKYYLSEYLEFLSPFVHTKTQPNVQQLSDCTDPGEDTNSNHAETENSDSQVDPNIDIVLSNIKSEPESSCKDPESDEFYFNHEEISNYSRKRKLQDDAAGPSWASPVDEAVASWIMSAREKEMKERDDPTMAFFRSLMPDIRKMSDRQNRHFKSRVLGLIDEILEGGDGDSVTHNNKSVS